MPCSIFFSDPKCIAVGKEYTTIIVIKEEDYHWLSHADFQLYVEDYITHAPASTHLDPYWSRYHGIPEETCGNCDGLGEDKGGFDGFVKFAQMTKPPEPPAGSRFQTPGNDMFAFKASELAADSDHMPLLDGNIPANKQLYLQKIKKNSPNFLNHTFASTSHIFRFTEKALRQDRRATYYNPKYEWRAGALLIAALFLHAGAFAQWFTPPIVLVCERSPGW